MAGNSNGHGNGGSRGSPSIVYGVEMGRRSFLKLSGLTVSATGLAGCVNDEVSAPAIAELSPAPHSFDTTVYRAADLVALRFDFYGLTPNAAGNKLVPDGVGERLIVVSHAPQHLLERAFQQQPDPNGPQQIVSHPVEARLAGQSRLVFKLPASFAELGYDLESLLEKLKELELRVSDHALPRDPSLPPLGGGSFVGPILGSGPSRIGSSARMARQQRTLQRLARSSGQSIQIAEPDPRIGPIFARVNPGPPEKPSELETALELPFRLLISPNHLAGFMHSKSAVEKHGRFELWHSRLGVRIEDSVNGVSVDEHNPTNRTIRALWARDMDNDDTILPPLPDVPFDASLTQADRRDIVRQTSDYTTLLKPRPVDVERLMLTSLGGWLKSRGEWERTRPIAAWDHRATMGRDHFVRVVRNGYACNAGHRSVVETITERKLMRPDDDEPYAQANQDTAHTEYLWKKSFIVFKETVREYDPNLRNIPFVKVVIKQLVTPVLDGPVDATKPFVPHVNGKPLEIPVDVVDREGRIFPKKMRFVWAPVKGDDSGDIDLGIAPNDVDTLYESIEEMSLDGARVAFADSEDVDDTTYEVKTMSFVRTSDGSGNNKPGIAPGLKQARLRVEAMRALSGSGADELFEYAPQYLTHGFQGQNAQGQVVLKAVNNLEMSFGSDTQKSGGFLSPSLSITGLSRKRGPIGGDPAKFGKGEFKPQEFFDKLDAKIFGVFKLGDILTEIGLDNAPTFITQAFDQVEAFIHGIAELPELYKTLEDRLGVSQAASLLPSFDAFKDAILVGGVGPLKDIDDINVGAVDGLLLSLLGEIQALPKEVDALKRVLGSRFDKLRALIASDLVQAIAKFLEGAELAKDLTVRLEWRPEIKPILGGLFQPNDPHGLLLSVEARGKDLPGKPAGVDLVASLEDFTINLFGTSDRFLSIPFEKLQFRVSSGKKPEIDVVFDDMIFDGVLAFVAKLAEILPLDGFSDPPNVTVNEEGIQAGFTIPLPNIAVGMFSLENLSISAGFQIPFIGPPVTVNFGFCTREQPFTLTVCMLGGGGFFGIHVSPEGVELLEAGFEFGASLSVDFGVASGGITIMAGIYFAIEQDEAQLTGYLRMRGEVDVLGLISASIELRMELTYQFSSKKVIGKATIEIEVSVLCFSATVEVTAEKKFAGSNEDPTFADVMDKNTSWPEYVLAFAA